MKDQTGFVLLVVLNVARKNIELKGCHRGCKIKMILSTNIDNIIYFYTLIALVAEPFHRSRNDKKCHRVTFAVQKQESPDAKVSCPSGLNSLSTEA